MGLPFAVLNVGLAVVDFVAADVAAVVAVVVGDFVEFHRGPSGETSLRKTTFF